MKVEMIKQEVRTVCFVTLFALGLSMMALGPALNDLADQTGSSLAALGAVFSTMFVGSLLTQIVVGPSIDRLGPRPILIVGLVLSALGLAGILLSPTLWLTLTLGGLMGVGFGALEISTNVWVVEVFADRSIPVMNLLHVCFGVGAVTGPGLAGLSIRLFDTALPVLWGGILVFLAPMVLVLRMQTEAAPTPKHESESAHPASGFNYFVPLLWVLGLMMLAYVGVETGIGAWTTTYIDHSTSLSKATGAMVTSGFWMALTAGRVTAALWGGRFSPYAVLRAAMIGALISGLVYAVAVGSAPLTILATLMVGFCFGPMYPVTVAITAASFRNGPGRATSLVAALGSIGGSALPWLEGQLLNNVSMTANALFVAVGIVGMLALYGVYNTSRLLVLNPQIGDSTGDR
jgi:FHS family Na+ dependent glucose MFS transporter 1